MRGTFNIALWAFALLSAAHAIPSPKNIDITIQIGEINTTPKQGTSGKERPLTPQDINVSEEFGVKLMFDEVITDGNYIWPDGYGNLDWSTNHYIFNESEQHLFPRNHASSPPNLLFVQDSSHSGGTEPYFKVRPNSPAQSFDLHGISILPYTATPNAPILFSIRGYPANGGAPLVRWYKWTWDYQLQYPWDAGVEGVNFVNKVEIFVIPGSDTTSTKRLPYTLDNIKLTWRNPPNAVTEIGDVETENVVIIENHGGIHQDL